jgi:chromosome segregation ATPase
MVVCTINPVTQNYQESLNTIKFARNAGAIKNTVKVNEISEFEYSNKKENERKDFLITELETENDELKEELIQLKLDRETKIQALEEELNGEREKNRVLNEEKSLMSRELKSERMRASSLEADYERARAENSDLIRLLNDMEEKISSFETERKSLHLIKEEYERKVNDLKYDVKVQSKILSYRENQLKTRLLF